VPQTDKTDMPLAMTRYTGVQRAKKDLVFKIRCLLISEKILPTVVVIQLSSIIGLTHSYVAIFSGVRPIVCVYNLIQDLTSLLAIFFVFWLFMRSITCIHLNRNNNTITIYTNMFYINI